LYRFTDLGGGSTNPSCIERSNHCAERPSAHGVPADGYRARRSIEVVVLHHLMRYMDLPGDDPSGVHDRVLGPLMGDILPHQYPTVEVPGTAFHLISNRVRVPSVEAMLAHPPPAWDITTAATLGPYTDQDPEIEVVRPRNTQLVPGRYTVMLECHTEATRGYIPSKRTPSWWAKCRTAMNWSPVGTW
jgi:hypothetical protein